MDEDDNEDDEDEGEEAGTAPHQDGQAVPDRKAWSSSSGFPKNVSTFYSFDGVLYLGYKMG